MATEFTQIPQPPQPPSSNDKALLLAQQPIVVDTEEIPEDVLDASLEELQEDPELHAQYRAALQIRREKAAKKGGLSFDGIFDDVATQVKVAQLAASKVIKKAVDEMVDTFTRNGFTMMFPRDSKFKAARRGKYIHHHKGRKPRNMKNYPIVREE